MTTKVEKGNSVEVEYTGKFEDGTVFDTTQNKEPISFQAGSGQVIKGFDDAVIGMAKGEEKTITITPENGYGLRDEKLTQKLPRSALPQHTKIEKGMGFSFRAPTGQIVHATVTEATEQTVTLDMNHPLAGRNLIFDIKLVGIKDEEK